jgi:hypothetical protein
MRQPEPPVFAFQCPPRRLRYPAPGLWRLARASLKTGPCFTDNKNVRAASDQRCATLR